MTNYIRNCKEKNDLNQYSVKMLLDINMTHRLKNNFSKNVHKSEKLFQMLQIRQF